MLHADRPKRWTLAEPDVIDGSEDLVGPTPSAPTTVMHTDAFMLPDVVADEEQFNAVMHEWFQELAAEDPITRLVADTTHCAPLSAIFGSALAPSLMQMPTLPRCFMV